MSSRREFLKATAGAAGFIAARGLAGGDEPAVEVNDVQSQLNATMVRAIQRPRSLDELQRLIQRAKREDAAVAVCGGRHAMGGQQFLSQSLLIDMTELRDVIRLDRTKGTVEVGAGIQWPELIERLNREQAGDEVVWTIREKQSGVDSVCLGGSLASNIHGRGLTFAPMVESIESFVLVDAAGEARTCSRRENPELFSLAIGGYGLFGIVATVTLRLVPRFKVERVVDVIPVRDLLDRVESRIDDGFLFGDCQYATALDGPAEGHEGVFACYRPVTTDREIKPEVEMPKARWAELYRLARTDRKKAFETYAKYYRSTNGQLYWSDRHQLSGNFQSYRDGWDTKTSTDMITELYVPPRNFLAFMAAMQRDFVEHQCDLTYGTIRFIEPDRETFLRWATERLVCVICNLHVQHTPEGEAKAAKDFRRLIDRASEFGGRYYLTYHRWATRTQVEACYPQFVEFLKLKRKYDPGERFQSNWYRHYRGMFGDRV
ncbi:MAG TPA: FAD-binding oxidoreductase [Caulifigura sp.]|nr:FAD-binding oxidoreductase [Caulifigura sp.]